jgi:UDPglucose 6-dehydrogenase
MSAFTNWTYPRSKLSERSPELPPYFNHPADMGVSGFPRQARPLHAFGTEQHGTHAAMISAEPLSVIGLGKLGLGVAACLARAGFDVLGVDLDPGLVERINDKASAFDEPGIASAIAATPGGTFRAATELSEAVAHTETTFMLLPTPSCPDGSFDSSTLSDVLTNLCSAIRAQNKQRFLIIIGSTVSPGTIAGTVVPIVERIMEQPIGETVSVCYNPEFVALGSVVADFERPDLILIGESDATAGAEVERILRRVVRGNPPVHHMSFVSAEIAKLALNNFLTAKISYANFLSQICSRVDGADVDAITSALADDSRIGGKYLRAGPPFGGPCLPRDVKALAAFARQRGRPTNFLEAIGEINRVQQHSLTEKVFQHVKMFGARSVGILGLSYNDTAPYVIESSALALIKRLHAEGVHIVAHDLRAMKAALREAGDLFTRVVTVDDCIRLSSVVVLLNRDPAYADAIIGYRGNDEKVVVDCWRALDPRAVADNVKVVRFGFWDAASQR